MSEELDLALSVLGRREIDVVAYEVMAESYAKQAKRMRELYEAQKANVTQQSAD